MTINTIKYRIKVSDTDCGGRVFFPNYARLINEASLHYLRSREITFHGSLSETYSCSVPIQGHFVVGEFSCRIEAPVEFDRLITVESKVRRLGRRSVTFECLFTEEGSAKTLAKGRITYVFVHDDKSIDIPVELSKQIKRAPTREIPYL